MSRSSTTRIFVCRAEVLRSQCWTELLELKIGFTGEPVRVRTDCSEKTVYFPTNVY